MKFNSLLLLLVIISSCYSSVTHAASNKVVIIASNDVAKLNINQLKSIFSLKQKLLPNKGTVTLLHQPMSAPTTLNFSQQLFSLYPYQLQRLWDRQVFSGRASAPTSLESEEEIFAVLESSSNTIAYVSANSPLLTHYQGKINVIATL